MQALFISNVGNTDQQRLQIRALFGQVCFNLFKENILHCMKSVHIRSFSGPHFPTFGLNTKIYDVNLRI